MTDEELLALCLSGETEEDAREEFALRANRIICRCAIQKDPSLAKPVRLRDLRDFCQDVLVRLLDNDWEKLRGFKGRSSLHWWLSVVVGRILIDRSRKRDTKQDGVTVALQDPIGNDSDSSTIEDILADVRADPRQEVMYNELAELVRKGWLEALDENQRKVLQMRLSGDYTAEEMAKILGTQPNTIHTWVRRARIDLLGYLKERGVEFV